MTDVIYTPGDILPAPLAHEERRGFLASAQTISMANVRDIHLLARTRQAWQKDATAMSYEVTELGYIGSFVGDALSRLRIFAAEQPDPESEPSITKHEGALTAVRELDESDVSMGGLLRTFGTNITYTGEVFLIGLPEYGGTSWDMYSVGEVQANPSTGKIRILPAPLRSNSAISAPANQQGIELDPRAFILRIWQRDWQFGKLATSHVRTCLDILESILIEERTARAISRSRMASAGILFLPEEAFPGPIDPTQDSSRDPVQQQLERLMLAALADEGAASSVVPLVMRMASQYIQHVTHLTFDRTEDIKRIDRMDHLLRRFAQGMPVPPEILLGTGDVSHWCMDETTEVLTRGGWRGPDNFCVGDECLTLDHNTGLTRWEPSTDMYLANVIDEPMLSIEGRFHSSLTTLDHSWPILRVRGQEKRWEREWVKSRDFATMAANRASGSQLPVKVLRGASSSAVPSVTKYDDALVELVGWMFTEGGLHYRDGATLPHQVSIYQSHVANADNCSRIRRALTALYGPPKTEGKVGHPTKEEMTVPSWREVQEGDRTRFPLNQAAWLPIVEHCPHRVVTNEFVDALTEPQLLLFLETAVRGDGHRMAGKTRCIGQQDPARLDAVERAAILLGYATHRWSTWHDGFHRHLQHYVTISERVEYRPHAGTVQEVPYTGRIWCPTVPPTHSVLARRNGKVFYTGQTAWQVDESCWKNHLEPLAIMFCDALTRRYLRPFLEESGMSTEEARTYRVWYDASKVTARPDMREDADKGLDFGIVSTAAWLKAHNFSPEDQAGMLELLRRIAFRSGDAATFLQTAQPGELPKDIEEALGVDQPGGLIGAEAQQKVAEQQATDVQTQMGIEGQAQQLEAGPVQPGPPKGGPPNAAKGPSGPKPGKTVKQRSAPRKPVTASASPDADVLVVLSEKLATIDASLADRVLVAADTTLRHATERAGARIRQAAKRDKAVVAALEGVDNAAVASTLSPSVVASLSLTERELVEDTIGAFGPRFLAWTSRAQDQARKVAADVLGDDASEQLALDQRADREAAWAWLEAALVEQAVDHFYTPGHLEVEGETDDTLILPYDIVREALARAGGADDAPSQAGVVAAGRLHRLASHLKRLGLAAGHRMEDFLSRAGVVEASKEWVYGRVPRSTFQPHEDLDGTLFTTWDDEALAWDEKTFPYVSHLHPADHGGCRCGVRREWEWLRGAEGPDGEVVVPEFASGIPGGVRTVE